MHSARRRGQAQGRDIAGRHRPRAGRVGLIGRPGVRAAAHEPGHDEDAVLLQLGMAYVDHSLKDTLDGLAGDLVGKDAVA